nr:MAG TPA: hypothetical protein [Caudoviricetes sp.]
MNNFKLVVEFALKRRGLRKKVLILLFKTKITKRCPR